MQQRVVDHDSGALLVVAGPGSGKTRALTERVRKLLQQPSEHFKILALTYSNKAAAEMSERLADLGEQRSRAVISTFHGFCLGVLADRGRAVGVVGEPQIFELTQDRRLVLQQAVESDPWLLSELNNANSLKERAARIDQWLSAISRIKSHPLTAMLSLDEFEQHLLDTYTSALTASNAYDFDDLLLLTYRLFIENPKIADLYRRIYQHICIDEAQDLNEAQYAVLTSLCGGVLRNVVMVGDPRQSIYGFNTSSPEFMDRFVKDFSARKLNLSQNFRSSAAVVEAAGKLIPEYVVDGQLPITGLVRCIKGRDERGEAVAVCEQIENLIRNSHSDLEGGFKLSSCAILARNRYSLVEIERLLLERGVPFYKRLSAAHEYEAEMVKWFMLGLRLLANPGDRFHFNALIRDWGGLPLDTEPVNDAAVYAALAVRARSPEQRAVVAALQAAIDHAGKVRMPTAIGVLKTAADQMDEEARNFVYRDAEIVLAEWDQYLRSKSAANATLPGFLSNMALGNTRQLNADGVALMTVHAAKGLEFDVVFIMGLTEGVFPDYRANTPKTALEELRNAFVAATRSRRLLFLSYPESRRMPWGDVRLTTPSRYILRMMG